MTKINLLTKFKEEEKNLNIGDSGSVPKVFRSTSPFKIRKKIFVVSTKYILIFLYAVSFPIRPIG